MSPAATSPQKTDRIVWWAHVARASAAVVVVFARFVIEFREQKTLVTLFTFASPIPLADMPESFAFHIYQWPRENLHIDPGTAAVGMFFGMVPAVRASRLNPIEALRHE